MFCSAHHRDYFAEAISARLKVQASVEAVENIIPPVLDLKSPLFGADATVDEGAVLDTALVDSIDIHCAAAEDEEDNDDAARQGLVSSVCEAIRVVSGGCHGQADSGASAASREVVAEQRGEIHDKGRAYD